MSILYRAIFSAIVSLALLVSVPAQAQDESAGYRFVYTSGLPSAKGLSEWVDETSYIPRHGVQVLSVGLEGDVELFSAQVVWQQFSEEEMYLSPDQSKLAVRRPNGDLLILDSANDLIADYQFSPIIERQWYDWYLWGWHGSNAVIISENVDDRLVFYEITLTGEPLTLDPIEQLNESYIAQFSVQNVYDTHSCLCDVIEYSPDLRYMLSSFPDARTVEEHESIMSVWDLETGTRHEIQRANPWWVSGSPHPTWSNSGEMFIFGRFGDHHVDFYIADADGEPRLLSDLECTVNYCAPGKAFWSPSDSYVAFSYSSEDYFDESPQLILIDMETGEQRTLLTEENGGGYVLYWSPDERFIAFRDVLGESSAISVIEVQTGNIVLTHELPPGGGLIGWITE